MLDRAEQGGHIKEHLLSCECHGSQLTLGCQLPTKPLSHSPSFFALLGVCRFVSLILLFYSCCPLSFVLSLVGYQRRATAIAYWLRFRRWLAHFGGNRNLLCPTSSQLLLSSHLNHLCSPPHHYQSLAMETQYTGSLKSPVRCEAFDRKTSSGWLNKT